MIDHSGEAGESFVCSGCKHTFEKGHYYHRIGNEIYCSEIEIPVKRSWYWKITPSEVIKDITEKYNAKEG
jgi:hypothetical protein